MAATSTSTKNISSSVWHGGSRIALGAVRRHVIIITSRHAHLCRNPKILPVALGALPTGKSARIRCMTRSTGLSHAAPPCAQCVHSTDPCQPVTQLNMKISSTEATPDIENLYLDMNGIIHNCTHANQREVGPPCCVPHMHAPRHSVCMWLALHVRVHVAMGGN